jgi:hypothetical protein
MKIAPLTERWNEGERDWSFVKNPTDDINRWESETKLTIPQDYRSFMIRFNGGRIYPRLFRTPLAIEFAGPYFDECDVAYVDAIFDWRTVALHWRGEVYGQGVPSEHLVFAETAGPIQLLMSLRKTDHGAIYSWRHTTYRWGTDGNDKLHMQADSFSAFLKTLTDGSGTDYQDWHLPVYDTIAREFNLE